MRNVIELGEVRAAAEYIVAYSYIFPREISNRESYKSHRMRTVAGI